MAKKNITVAGDYKGSIFFRNPKKGLFISDGTAFSKKTYINKETVASYEEVSAGQQGSFGSGVAKGIVGGALFGGVGAIAGAASGSKKNIHTVSIAFKDGTRCLCDLDDAMFKNLMTVMY